MEKLSLIKFCIISFLLILSQITFGEKQSNYKSHGISYTGELKYEKGFAQLPHASPDAIKGGSLTSATVGTFDSLNPFILKGKPASSLGLIYDTLMDSDYDDVFTYYGVLAEYIEMPADKKWIKFHLNPNARFSDGEEVTAQDVVFSFYALTEQGSPLWKQYWGDVAKVEAESKYVVRFDSKNPENKELPIILGQIYVLPEHYWKDKKFAESTLEIPVGSGPYVIEKFEAGRNITYKRNKDYWAKDHSMQKGFYNFDHITIEYYKDDNVMFEAFKAGEFDVHIETTARRWHTSYDFPALRDGKVVKKRYKDNTNQGLVALAPNIRKPLFQDKSLRMALNYALDFEWVNKNITYNEYKRSYSFFTNSELASSGLPEGRELEILNQYKDQLSSDVFTKAYVNPVNDGSGNNRQNLRKAKKILTDAGYTIKGGQLISPITKAPVTFELLTFSDIYEPHLTPWLQSLKKLGIEANFRRVDQGQYIKRIQTRDFDMIVHSFRQSDSPGNEQREYFGSTAAEHDGSENYMGVKHPVIDKIIESLIQAPNRDELVAHTRALDRILLSEHYLVPMWYGDFYRIAYWDKFDQPERTAKFLPAFRLAFYTWWENPKKVAELKK